MILADGGRVKVALDGVLTIADTTESDCGVYTCVVENMAAVQRRAVTLALSCQ